MNIENNQMLIYRSKDEKIVVEVLVDQDTLWVNQLQMAELFGTTKQNISLHISNILKDGELDQIATVKDYLTVASNDKKYKIKHYNLDMIIAVGFRVKSPIGTQFRIWANEVLREYAVKGFAMNDELLKKAGGGRYFDELLERIRDIRTSEKVFWRKVLDIYATSIDYNPHSEISHVFFATIQNKMHWASHGHTAAEIIMLRANADRFNMGMTSYKGNYPTKQEARTAKNYLDEQELDILNRIVTSYLEFAELQAKSGKVMHMKNWSSKLDDFFKLSDREILTHKGTVSNEAAMRKADEEYEKFKEYRDNELSAVDKDFLESIEKKYLKGKS